jgi:hypothetical protein
MAKRKTTKGRSKAKGKDMAARKRKTTGKATTKNAMRKKASKPSAVRAKKPASIEGGPLLADKTLTETRLPSGRLGGVFGPRG